MAHLGDAARVEPTTLIDGGKFIRIDESAYVGGQGQILVPDHASRQPSPDPVIRIGAGTSIGGYCTISAINHIYIGKNVLFGPRVWITDHNHAFTDIERPVMAQGLTTGGSVDIGDGCWISVGAVIIGARGLTIGRGSIIGANAVITSSVPEYCVVGGNPARIIRRYDKATQTWQRAGTPETEC